MKTILIASAALLLGINIGLYDARQQLKVEEYIPKEEQVVEPVSEAATCMEETGCWLKIKYNGKKEYETIKVPVGSRIDIWHHDCHLMGKGWVIGN